MRRAAFAIACIGSLTMLALAVGCGGGDESLFLGRADGGDGGESPGPGPFVGTDGGGGGDTGGGSLDCDAGCPDGFVCVGTKCLPPQGACGADGGACQFDTYCDPGTKTCVPFAPGGNDPACTQLSVPGNFAPKTKCEFPTAIPIAGDAFPNHVDVQTTPVVVRFGPAATPPSIVAPFTEPVPFTGTLDNYTEHLGVLRTATAGLAARLQFALDEIEDLRIAVDEACAMLLAIATRDAELECRFAVTDDALTVEVTVPTVRGATLPSESSFAWKVLTALTTGANAHASGGRATISLLTRRAGGF